MKPGESALSSMPHVGMLPYALKVFRQHCPGVRRQAQEGLFPDREAPLREHIVDFQRGAAPRAAPAPGLVMQASAAMSIMVSLAHSDLLAMLAVPWGGGPLTRDALQSIHVREALPVPSIVRVQRPDAPLTPAAEYRCDVLQRLGPAKPA